MANDQMREALTIKLRSLITEQSEGEWDDLLIEKDVLAFTNALLPQLQAAYAAGMERAAEVLRERFILPDAPATFAIVADFGADAIRAEIPKEGV